MKFYDYRGPRAVARQMHGFGRPSRGAMTASPGGRFNGIAVEDQHSDADGPLVLGQNTGWYDTYFGSYEGVGVRRGYIPVSGRYSVPDENLIPVESREQRGVDGFDDREAVDILKAEVQRPADVQDISGLAEVEKAIADINGSNGRDIVLDDELGRIWDSIADRPSVQEHMDPEAHNQHSYTEIPVPHEPDIKPDLRETDIDFRAADGVLDAILQDAVSGMDSDVPPGLESVVDSFDVTSDLSPELDSLFDTQLPEEISDVWDDLPDASLDTDLEADVEHLDEDEEPLYDDHFLEV